GATLESMLKVIRYLVPVLVPAGLRTFGEDAIALFDEAPASAIALLAAAQIANVHRNRSSAELPPDYLDAVQAGNALRHLQAALKPEELRELTDRMQAATDP